MNKPASHPQLSIIIPFLNEQASLPLLKERFEGLKGLPEAWEIVFVSDGSTDRSQAIVEEWARQDSRVKMIVLSRNFGHQAAISAGLAHASGDFVGMMDADLQDPPEVLITMYEEALTGGWDIVYSVRSRREGSLFKRAAYRVFYSLYTYLADSPADSDSGDFSILSRKAVEALRSLPEKIRFVRGLRSWLGMRSKALKTSRPGRAAGKAQYSFKKLMRLAMEGLTSFSARPLHLATIAGALLCSGAFLLSLVYFINWLVADTAQRLPGFTTLVILILFVSGAQFFMMGIIGEYIGQIFLEVKGRPTYLVDRKVNFD